MFVSNQSFDSNNVQYVAVPQPQLVQPVMYLATPQLVTLPPQPAMTPLLEQSIPAEQPVPMLYNGTTFVELPQSLIIKNQQGALVCPSGFSFVTMDVPSNTVEPSLSLELSSDRLLSLPSVATTSRSRSSSVVSDVVLPEVQASKTKDEVKGQGTKKFRHRSKQMRILEVHAKLKEEYTDKGIYAAENEVLRGYDTVRVHVKTYKALNKIESPLSEVENDPRIEVLKIATPFSMKNKFQKKGFIVYLKLAEVEMVPIVQNIFGKYEDFTKCDVALKKEDKLAEERKRAESMHSMSSIDSNLPEFLSSRKFSNEGVDFSDWSSLNKLTSIGA